MKKILFIILSIATIVAITTSCTESKSVDPIHDTTPVDTSLRKGLPMNTYYNLSFEEKKQMMDKHRRQLTANAFAYTAIHNEDEVQIIIASGEAKKVPSGDGKNYSGNFTEEPIIITNGILNDTIFIFNGARANNVTFSSQTNLGKGEQWRFNIQEDKSFKSYIDLIEKWDSVDIASTSYIMPGLKDGECFSSFLKNKEPLFINGDIIDVLQKRVINKNGDVVNFRNRERLRGKKGHTSINSQKIALALLERFFQI